MMRRRGATGMEARPGERRGRLLFPWCPAMRPASVSGPWRTGRPADNLSHDGTYALSPPGYDPSHKQHLKNTMNTLMRALPAVDINANWYIICSKLNRAGFRGLDTSNSHGFPVQNEQRPTRASLRADTRKTRPFRTRSLDGPPCLKGMASSHYSWRGTRRA